jgi:serine phosphatase RsbU (regulator of sigma subunit)
MELGNTHHFDDTIQSGLKFFANDPLVAKPGAAFHYSTQGFTLVGCVLEGASGEKYVDYVQKNVLQPAGMLSTRTDDRFAIIPYRTRFYEKSKSGQIQNADFLDSSYKVAGGGWLSNADDMARFMVALLTDDAWLTMPPLPQAYQGRDVIGPFLRRNEERRGTPLRLVRYVEKAEQRSAEEIIGVLYLDSRERGALRSVASQQALDTLSAEAALAIENARLYREALDKAKFEQELKVAAAIQQSLLPPAARQGAYFSTAAASIACRAVGGDFFDYVDLPNAGFGFIVGDVAGKGSPAALLAAAVLGMFSAEAMYQTSPAAVITRLNQGLFRRAIESRFLTTFYGIMKADGAFTYCNAGHNPPILLSPSGVRRLETGGVVLGLFEHASFEEETVQLQPGDAIVVFSDGVTEALNPQGDEYTDERLVASVTARPWPSPQDAVDAVLADVRSFCGDATQSDDVTMMMVRYGG